MIPILFNATATTFTTHGIGNMAEAISCEVTKDGMMYELQMTYPVTGKRFADIVERNIVVAKPDLLDNPQPFRIYRITKPIDGRITLYARHINYDMAGIPVSNFTATSAADFATKIKSNALVSCPFSFSTDIVDSYTLKIEEPDVMRSLLGGKDRSWQGVYGGDIVFNGYNVQLKQNGGQDRDITVRYGVDIVDAQMERDIAEVYTGIIPFYKGNVNNAQTETQEEIIVIGDVQNASGTFNYTKVQPVDISSLIQTENPSKAQVNAAGQLWLSGNDIGKTLVSLTLDYAQINNKVVQLYDYITVDIPKLGVTVKSKVIKTVFDVLKERYTSIDVGDNKGKLSRDLYDASRLKHGTLKSERIANASIGASKLGAGSVGSGALAKWAVKDDKMAKDSVTINAIKDGAVITDKIANDAVTTPKIIADAIIAEKIRNGEVITDKIRDNAVTMGKVLDKAITYAKLSEDLQIFVTDILAANAIYSAVIDNNGAIRTSSLTTGVIYINGVQGIWNRVAIQPPSTYYEYTTCWVQGDDSTGYYVQAPHTVVNGVTQYVNCLFPAQYE